MHPEKKKSKGGTEGGNTIEDCIRVVDIFENSIKDEPRNHTNKHEEFSAISCDFVDRFSQALADHEYSF